MKPLPQPLATCLLRCAPLVWVVLACPLAASSQEPAADSPPPASSAVPVNPLRSPSAVERLPWEKQESKSSNHRLRPISGPREFLDRYGISTSQWDGFVDGQALSAAEEEVVIRLLHLYPKLGQENVEAWAARDLTADQLVEAAAQQRGKIVRLTGRVRRVSRIDLIPELANRYDFAWYYQVRMQLDGMPRAADFYCLEVPIAWKLDTELDEQAAAYGLFLKVGSQDEPPPLLLVTHRIVWLPAQRRPEMQVAAAHVALASLGVDIGRLQLVGKERGTGLSTVDREPFYQILAALGDQRASELLAPQNQELDVVTLLQQPHKLQGHVLPVQGLARRIARVDVPDADIRQRFGIDHYYEIDLSLPLAQTVKLRAEPENKAEAVVYEHSFPATICVRELPPGMSVGDDLRQPIQASAVFFKIWLYHSAYTQRARLAQPAPLFLARQVQLVAEEEPSRFWSDLIVGAALLLAALTFAGIVLWFRWSDRAGSRSKPLLQPPQPPPDFLDLR